METPAHKAAREALESATGKFKDAKAVEAEARGKRERAWAAVQAAQKVLAATA
jgi:hypothetical protein